MTGNAEVDRLSRFTFLDDFWLADYSGCKEKESVDVW